jgi:hypothetical protein
MITSWKSKHVAKHLCSVKERWYVSKDLILFLDITVVQTALLILLYEYDTQQDACHEDYSGNPSLILLIGIREK